MHILLYGGTFDPIHNGHLLPAEAARKALGADKLLLIPAYLSPHKLSHAPASSLHRLRMLQLAIQDRPQMGADDREIQRGGHGTPSYTYDTVAELQSLYPNDRFTLLVGTDQLPKLHTWHKVADLLARVPIAVMPRPNHPVETGLAEVGRQLGSAAAGKLRGAVLATPLVDVSATQIRDLVRQNLSIHHLVPAAVAEYIGQQNLYR